MARSDGSYRLERGETAADGLRRIGLGRADRALDELEGRGSGSRPEAIHETRKDLKKLRSVLRLVREEIGEKAYRDQAGRFREAGRMLAGTRDAEVKLRTMERIQERGPLAPTEGPLRRYALNLEEERDRLARQSASEPERDLTQQVAGEIEAGRATVEGWDLGADGWPMLAGGLQRSYRQGRNRLRDVSADPSEENVHEWRKRVKDLWHQLRILRPIWPEVLGETADQSHHLSELLGDHHDLAVLAADAAARAAGPDGEPELMPVIEAARQWQAELVREALPIGERLYAERPKAFVSRLEAYWYAWRAD